MRLNKWKINGIVLVMLSFSMILFSQPEMDNDRSEFELRKSLHDPIPWVRERAAAAIGKKKITEAAGELRRLLKDPFFWVRRQAVMALGEIGSPSAVEGLKAALTDPVWLVRSAAEDSLRRLGVPFPAGPPREKSPSAIHAQLPRLEKGQPIPDAFAGFIKKKYADWLGIWRQPGIRSFQCTGFNPIHHHQIWTDDLTQEENKPVQMKYCITFSPDYYKALDLGLGYFLDGNQPQFYSGDDISEVHLIELDNHRRTQLLAIGTCCFFDDAAWWGNESFVVVGWSESDQKGREDQVVPTLHIFDLSKDVEAQFEGQAIPVESDHYRSVKRELTEWQYRHLLKK